MQSNPPQDELIEPAHESARPASNPLVWSLGWYAPLLRGRSAEPAPATRDVRGRRPRRWHPANG